MFDFAKFKTPDRKFGALQIVHDFKFVALNITARYDWAEDTPEEDVLAHIRGRMDRLYDRGYSGIVLCCDYKHYMDDRFVARMSHILDYAKKLDMRVWLYDEQYYPTGSAGGLTLKDHPELNFQILNCVVRDVGETYGGAVRIPSPLGNSGLKYAFAVPKGEKPGSPNQIDISRWVDPAGGLCWDKPEGEYRVYCFFVAVLYEHNFMSRRPRASRRIPNVSDKRVMNRYLEVTFGKYAEHLAPYFGTVIEATFLDEPRMFVADSLYPADRDPSVYLKTVPTESIYDIPNADIPMYPNVTWSDEIVSLFESRCGYSLIPKLPALFDGDLADTRQVRRDFYTTWHETYCESFIKLYKEKVNSLGIKMSGHFLCHEYFSRHVEMAGDYLRIIGSEDIPGCDELFSDPKRLHHSVALKMAASAADLYGKPHVMIEASDMTDKVPLTIARYETAISLMFSLGINTITSYYGEEVLTEEEYKEGMAYIARLSSLLRDGIHQLGAVLFYPYEYLASLKVVGSPDLLPKRDIADPIADAAQETEDSLNNTKDTLLDRQVDFVYINKETLLSSKVDNEGIHLRTGAAVKTLIFPKMLDLDDDVRAFVDLAAAQGVEILYDGICHGSGKLLSDNFPVSKDLSADCDMPGVNAFHKSFADYELYLLVNSTETEYTGRASVPFGGASLMLLDLRTGDASDLVSEEADGRCCFDLHLAPLETKLILVRK